MNKMISNVFRGLVSLLTAGVLSAVVTPILIAVFVPIDTAVSEQFLIGGISFFVLSVFLVPLLWYALE